MQHNFRINDQKWNKLIGQFRTVLKDQENNNLEQQLQLEQQPPTTTWNSNYNTRQQ